MGRKSWQNTAAMNNMVENDYYVRLRQLALSVFEWDGLPPTCDARFLEKTLCDFGRAIFVNDSNLGYLNLRCTPAGIFNVYFVPTAFTAYSHNYSQTYYTANNDNVFIRNNYEEYPTDITLRMFAKKLAANDRTMDVNRNAQKTPLIIITDEKTRLTLENIYKQYDGNEPVIYGDKNFMQQTEGGNVLKVLKTDAPFLLDKLYQDKMNIWNEVLTFLGINNANTDKRERLITDEVNSNNHMVLMSAETMLKARQEAVKEINSQFGLSVSVRRKTFDELFPDRGGEGD